MGYIVLQPTNEEAGKMCIEAIEKKDMESFDKMISECKLHPVRFGSRRCTEPESHLHSFTGEIASGRWSIAANKKFLWGKHFYWICDCNAVKEVLEYDGNIHQIRRWSQELLGYHFTVIHRPAKMMKDVDALSRGRHYDEAQKDGCFNCTAILLSEYESAIQEMRNKDLKQRPKAQDPNIFRVSPLKCVNEDVAPSEKTGTSLSMSTP
jgi:hypothetical protein